MRVLYFGCWDAQKGHYLREPSGRMVHDYAVLPWKSIDGALCPGYVRPYENGPQIQGDAALHHLGGWTALAFWDRSMDPRGGCNSAVFAEGTYGPAAMLEIAASTFPAIWARFTFEVRVVSRLNDVENPRHVCAICGRKAHGAMLDGWAHDPPGWFRRAEALACSVACVTKGIVAP